MFIYPCLCVDLHIYHLYLYFCEFVHIYLSVYLYRSHLSYICTRIISHIPLYALMVSIFTTEAINADEHPKGGHEDRIISCQSMVNTTSWNFLSYPASGLHLHTVQPRKYVIVSPTTTSLSSNENPQHLLAGAKALHTLSRCSQDGHDTQIQ